MPADSNSCRLAVTAFASEHVARATQITIARRGRLILVVNAKEVIEGLISAHDTMGEKPVTLFQELRGQARGFDRWRPRGAQPRRMNNVNTRPIVRDTHRIVNSQDS